MKFKSTRDEKNVLSPSQAILKGLADDGGLYVPVEFPNLDLDWERLKGLTYQELAVEVMGLFFTDFSKEQLEHAVYSAYDDKFDDPQIAPLKSVNDQIAYLELFHGSTIAFKDMALSILPYLMKASQEINGDDNEIIILTATSGDTGKAAMAGFADVPGTKIIVFYPTDGVSDIQEKQMLTQKGDNTYIFAIKSNFDDAQTNVKAMLNNADLREKLAQENTKFSSANSINIGRLIPQVVYYVWSYLRQLEAGRIQAGDNLNFVVPTGNFGNILAAYYAKRIGLPVNKLITASNDNKVLFDFFQTGTYDKNRPFMITTSPSMDILVSSNFERMLYFALGEDTEKLNVAMSDLQTQGKYSVTEETLDNFNGFLGYYSNEDQVAEEIRQIDKEFDYIIDPHTAVASQSYRQYQAETGDTTPTVIVSTASPYKFAPVVLDSLGQNIEGESSEQLLTKLNGLIGGAYPATIEEIRSSQVREKVIIEADQMQDSVESVIFKK